jgi:glycosyltransferase involved in cell wall biosynthesis
MPEPQVSVVVCAHSLDRVDDLRSAVASIRAQTVPPVEVLVVIDNNDELHRAAGDLATATAPPVTVVRNTATRGLSGARNTGTELASGDVVAYLDDDAVAADDRWLGRLTSPFADPTVMAVGGWAEPRWDGPPPDWFPPELAWVVGCSHRGLPTERARVRNVIVCNMALRRRAVLEVGGFDVSLGRTADRPAGGEETELCIRIAQADPDAVVLLEPAARVLHRVPASRARWQYLARRCFAEGRSKAHLSRLVGRDDGLRSERAYVARVLPAAILRALRGLPRAPLSNLQRMMAIVGGLAATTGGYLEHCVRNRV